MTKYGNLSTKTKLSTKKSPKLRQPTKLLIEWQPVKQEHANKEPIVNFKFARLVLSPFLWFKST